MDIIPDKHCPITPLPEAWYKPFVKRVDMLRLDMLHPVISGNKWYKLTANLAHAKDGNYKRILTFGGAYSNHLIAAAAAANAYGLSSIGIVRGLHAQEQTTPTLEACIRYGMQLVYVSREEYAQKTDIGYLQCLTGKYNEPFIIPEGGANQWGREGILDIAAQIPDIYTHICVSVGTGTTIAGLINSMPDTIGITGYIPMKGGMYMHSEIERALTGMQKNNWQLFDDWHFGGFGKWNEELLHFMNSFYSETNIPLDVVYTGKMMYAVKHQIQESIFPSGASILCIHTGGLQGNSSLEGKLLYV